MLKIFKSKKVIIICLLLVIAIIAGITMAYFTTFTVPKVNTFTLGNNISIRLAEPKWDNINYDYAPAGVTDTLGVDLAENFAPGRVIPKNPSVKNTSQTGNNVWIAIKIDYTVGQVGSTTLDPADTYAELDKFADIDWIGIGSIPGKWELKDTSHTIFYYNEAVSSGSNTIDLFDKVTIQSNVTINELHQFSINVKAYAVQEEGLSFANAKIELDNLIASNP